MVCLRLYTYIYEGVNGKTTDVHFALHIEKSEFMDVIRISILLFLKSVTSVVFSIEPFIYITFTSWWLIFLKVKTTDDFFTENRADADICLVVMH